MNQNLSSVDRPITHVLHSQLIEWTGRFAFLLFMFLVQILMV